MGVVGYPRRDEIWLVALDPTLGSELKKTRPCLIVSPNEVNEHLRTVIIAPLTSTLHEYPTRLNITFQQKAGQIALDQLRVVARERLLKKLGMLPTKTAEAASSVLVSMFTR